MNKVQRHSAGYTIVESMIFLAISGTLIMSVMLLVGGQQSKSEFAVGIRDIQSQLQDIMNDVSTGLYDYKNVFTCQTASDTTAPYTQPNITSGASGLQQGANSNCTFVGKVLQFAPDPAKRTTVLHTLVGRRQVGSPGTDARTLSEAAPRMLDYDTALDETATVIQLPYGITIQTITHGANVQIGSVAFMARFAGNAGSGGITGSQDIDIIPIENSTLGDSRTVGESTIDTELLNSEVNANPSTGITLCFKSGGTDQHGIIILGGPNRQLSANLTIGSGDCPS